MTAVRILHLEDNPADAELIRALFAAEHFACEIERTPNRRAYETALAQRSYDLILCDNNLPDYDGTAALRLARTRCPLTPVLIISGAIGEEEAIRSLQFGATDYLLKDRLERLVPAARRALDEAREHRERLQAESELRRNEERLRLALTATNDGIWDWDLITGAMVCNSAFEDLFGRPTEGVALRAWWIERTLPEEREDVTASLDAAIAGPARFWSKSYSLRRRDGRWAHVHNRVCLARDSSGKVVRLIGAVQDVTESIEAERERRVLEEQLRQAQKLEAIGTLAGGIAHDFNNILGIILTNADLARFDLPPNLPPDHGTVESLREITTAANRARDLVRQILTFSRRADTHLTVMKVQPVVRECLQLLRSTIPAMVTIDKSIDPACSCIVGDPTQLHQVVMNLCTNAWHALPERNGLIAVTVDEIPVSDAHVGTISDPSVRRLVRIAVRDNGHGMDAATRSRVFEPFFTTKAAGTGLGLAVVHGIMKAHSGAIDVQSTPGEGTTFNLYFPAQELEPDIIAVDEPAGIRGHGQHILLVDDDVAMGRSLQRFLIHRGYEAELFHTAPAALAAFNENPDSYDLVITDFSMPTMSGMDLAASIKRVRASVPVLILTGSTGVAEQHRTQLTGSCELLTKPIAPEALAEVVGQSLNLKANR